MPEIRKQINRILLLSGLGSFQLAGASWVALLAARGFTMVEIGLAESCFHLASLLFEIPSGVISDIFGRKKSMALSQCLFVLSALCMAFSQGLAGVCAALVLDAWGYNFASGAREALVYDSLKIAGREDEYLDYSSREMSIYRVGNASAILCAGLALMIGHRAACLVDALLGLACLMLCLRLREARTEEGQFEGSVSLRMLRCFRESACFLVHGGKSLGLMLLNSAAGAIATLTLFFLQARLSDVGLNHALLGPALFFISMGGAIGARLAVKASRMRYAMLFALCAAGIAAGLACGTGTSAALMCLGGFVSGLCDDLLQVRTDALLNERFPSAQRATLISVESLCFSLVMIVLSPLAGKIFSL